MSKIELQFTPEQFARLRHDPRLQQHGQELTVLSEVLGREVKFNPDGYQIVVVFDEPKKGGA